ncbi:hypothetical protein KIN20_018512 [Parelaphostrongylus tenuis]|uniref:Uncharacterized protein n=1 Tax=Parelaphostrongylus tenuis TaxID=148309 RepID=A0AAD5QUD9_PARTN|nr:hypothetical protein KIN20_018512 [Parelaphostrongylus tenuis]
METRPTSFICATDDDNTIIQGTQLAFVIRRVYGLRQEEGRDAGLDLNTAINGLR